MSNDLVKNEFVTQLQELDKIQETCAKLMKTKHYANLGEIGIHTIMARAKTLGIHPFEALNGNFYVVHGKVGMSTEMMAALVRKRGHSVRKDPKSNNEICILHGKRADTGDEWTCSFSKEDAISAGLWSNDQWKKRPGVMLYNRCMSMLFRQLFPDLSLGSGYVEDELREITKTGDYHQPIDIPVEQMPDVKQLYIENKQEEKPTVETITADQGTDLLHILAQCSSEFRDNVFNFVHSICGSKDIYQLPVKHYEATRQKAIKNMQEQHAKQTTEVSSDRQI